MNPMNPMSAVPPGQGVPEVSLQPAPRALVGPVLALDSTPGPDAELCDRYERAARWARAHRARQRLLEQALQKV